MLLCFDLIDISSLHKKLQFETKVQAEKMHLLQKFEKKENDNLQIWLPKLMTIEQKF